MRAMNTDVLEADWRKKHAEATALYKRTLEACDAHEEKNPDGTVRKGRPMTGDEIAAVQKIMDEATAIKDRLNVAVTENKLGDAIDKLTAGMTATDRTETKAAALKSIGQQWVEGPAGEFFFKKQHHGTRNWSSPTQELLEPDRRMATTLTTQAGSGQALIIPQYLPGILPLLFRPLTIRALLGSGTTDSPLIVYMLEQTFTNAAAAVAEGALKPESALVFSQVQEAVSKLAHWLPVTEEMLEDVAQIRDYIDQRLILGLDLVEEDQLLNGNGVAPNLNGLMNRTGVQTTALVTTAPAETVPDGIYRAMMQVFYSAWVMPTGIIMNPTNWSHVALLKDTLGRYLGSGPWSSAQTPTLWGLPVVVTPAIAAGTALIGAFNSQAQVFARGGTRVEASNSHQDFFVKNLVAIRAERRLALAVYRPASFIKVTGLL